MSPTKELTRASLSLCTNTTNAFIFLSSKNTQYLPLRSWRLWAVPLRRGYRVGRVGAPVHGGWPARSRGRIGHGSESVTRRRRREDDGSRRRFFRMFGGE